MPVKRSKRAPYYWEVRFWLAGREVRRSAKTHDKRAAEDYEQKLRGDLWRQVKLGERQFTWGDAEAQLKAEDSDKRSWERTARALDLLRPYLGGARLDEIDRKIWLKVRELLSRRVVNDKPIGQSTVNRVLAVGRIVMNRAAADWHMIDRAPRVPMFRVKRRLPIWGTRPQVIALLNELPEHSRDMSIIAASTGMRKSEVAGIEHAHVDLKRATLYVPPENAKNGRARVVPLNADAIAVLDRWSKPRPFPSNQYVEPRQPHPRYVFSYRGRAPIKKLSTATFRAACRNVGLPDGFSFHKLRHSWASWHAQDGTPLQILMELGGWQSLDMVLVYAHLAPGHLAQHAATSLLSDPTKQVRKPERVDELAKRRA